MIPVTYKYDTNTYHWGGHIEDTRTEVGAQKEPPQINQP